MGAISHRRWTAAFLAMSAAIGLSAVVAVGQPAPPPATPDPALYERLATADVAAGATAGAACLGCHTVTEGGAAGTGPNLYGIVGAPIARDPTFAYSPAMAALGAAGGTWTYEFLDQFLTSPFLAVLGTRMGFGGLADPVERANVIAWLAQQAATPVPIPGAVAAAADDPTRPVFQGYQADLGLLFFGEECADCHGPTGGGIEGAGPPLKGPVFQAAWSGRTVWDLFNYTRRFMPEDEPGGLEDQLVARILSYVLEVNGFTRSDQPFMVTRDELEPLILNFPPQ
ncbi:MAG: c-type cytochrome [Bauldia sp.]